MFATASLSRFLPGRGLRQYLAIAGLMLLLLALGFVLRGAAFAFLDIGGDTFVQFLPLQVANVHQLQQGQLPGWSFEVGLGAYLGVSIDPFWYLGALAPEKAQLALRLPIFLLKLLLDGGFFYAYLRVLGFRRDIGVLGGLCYAFSAYAVLNGQWDPHGTETVQLAAYLFLLERYLRDRRAGAAVAAGIVVGIGATFGIYTFALFSVVYGLLRLLLADAAQRRDLLPGLCRFALWCCAGLLLLAPLQLPALYYLFDSPRVSGSHSSLAQLLGAMFERNPRSLIAIEIAGLFGKDLLGTGNAYQGWGNYFEGPGFYIGLLPLLGIPQLLAPAAGRNARRIFVIGMLLIAAYLVFPALRYTVYGFGHVAFRFSSLWVSTALLLMGLVGLQRGLRDGIWRPGLILGALTVLAVLGACATQMPQMLSVGPWIRHAAFVAVYAALLWPTSDATWRARLNAPLVLLLAAELLMAAVPPLFERPAVPANGVGNTGSYADGTAAALELAQQDRREGDFYRVEKTYHSVFLCDALVQHYAGIKSYFFHGSALARFVDGMGFSHLNESTSYIEAPISHPDLLNLLGVRYLLSRDREPDGWSGLTYIGAAGAVNVYRNDAAHDVASFYDRFADEADAVMLDPAGREQLLSTTVLVDDAAAVRAHLLALETAVSGATTTVDAPTRLLRHTDEHLSGSLQTAHARLLLVAMPFDPNWHARLDGEAVPLLRADYGLSALPVGPGTHTLQLDYLAPGRRLGWLLSAASALSLVVLAAFGGWRRRRITVG